MGNKDQGIEITRRPLVQAATLGGLLAGLGASAAGAATGAAPMLEFEKANEDLVNNFCWDWSKLDVEALISYLSEDIEYVLLDIRTQAEIERGVLPNAITLPMHLVPLKLSYFSDSPKQVVVYCRTGSRSAQVCRFLNEQGIHNVISLRGGVTKWTSGGHRLDPRPAGKVG